MTRGRAPPLRRRVSRSHQAAWETVAVVQMAQEAAVETDPAKAEMMDLVDAALVEVATAAMAVAEARAQE